MRGSDGVVVMIFDPVIAKIAAPTLASRCPETLVLMAQFAVDSRYKRLDRDGLVDSGYGCDGGRVHKDFDELILPPTPTDQTNTTHRLGNGSGGRRQEIECLAWIERLTGNSADP